MWAHLYGLIWTIILYVNLGKAAKISIKSLGKAAKNIYICLGKAAIMSFVKS
jgi:hypothetical protein